MVEINRVWLNVDTDTNKITLFSRPRVSIRVDEYIWSLIEEHIVKPHNIRIIELLRFLYQQTDEAHAVTVSEMIEYLKSKGIPSVRQTVYCKEASA